MKHLNLFGREELIGLLVCFILVSALITIQFLVERLKTNKVRRKYGGKVEPLFTWEDLWVIPCASALASIMVWLMVLYCRT